eukprot:3051203-Rhodomonas_salina.1
MREVSYSISTGPAHVRALSRTCRSRVSRFAGAVSNRASCTSNGDIPARLTPSTSSSRSSTRICPLASAGPPAINCATCTNMRPSAAGLGSPSTMPRSVKVTALKCSTPPIKRCSAVAHWFADFFAVERSEVQALLNAVDFWRSCCILAN